MRNAALGTLQETKPYGCCLLTYRLYYTYTNQLHDDGPADGQPRVHPQVVENKQLVRSAPYADDKGGRDEHVQKHVEHGQRAVRPRWINRAPVGRRSRRSHTRIGRAVMAGCSGGQHKSTAAIADLVGRTGVDVMRRRRRTAACPAVLPPTPGPRELRLYILILSLRWNGETPLSLASLPPPSAVASSEHGPNATRITRLLQKLRHKWLART